MTDAGYPEAVVARAAAVDGAEVGGVEAVLGTGDMGD
jgi:hypothetical protein